MKKVQVTGSATIIGSKSLSTEVFDKMLEAPEGQHAELLVKFPVGAILKGEAKKSKSGNITCRFAIKSDNYEIVIVPDKAEKKEVNLDELTASLL